VEALLNRYLRKGNRGSRASGVGGAPALTAKPPGCWCSPRRMAVQEQLKNNWDHDAQSTWPRCTAGWRKNRASSAATWPRTPDQFVHTVAHRGLGKLARTAYTVIKRNPALSVLRINLLTGRKNQIRVQFADLGHPVAGDPKYGIKDRFKTAHGPARAHPVLPHPHRREPRHLPDPAPDYFLELIHGLSDADWDQV
jgi:hypothetical protein